VSELSGKLNGSVAVRGKGGDYLRNRVIPTNANTPAQIEVRQLFATVSKLWSNLTETQRDSWNSATETWKYSNLFADIKKLSGKALHQKLNSNLVLNGFPAIEVAPEKSEFQPYNVSEAVYSISGNEKWIEIKTVDETNFDADTVYIARLSKRGTAGTYRFVNFKTFSRVTPYSLNNYQFGGTSFINAIAAQGGAVEGATFGYQVLQLNKNTGESTPVISGRLVVSL